MVQSAALQSQCGTRACALRGVKLSAEVVHLVYDAATGSRRVRKTVQTAGRDATTVRAGAVARRRPLVSGLRCATVKKNAAI